MSPARHTPFVMRRRKVAALLMEVALRVLPKADRPEFKKACMDGIRSMFTDRIVFVDAFEGIPTKPRTMVKETPGGIGYMERTKPLKKGK